MGRKVLLDIDNTITTPTKIIDKMADMFGKPYVTAEDLESYTLSSVFDTTREEDKMFWDLFGYEVIEESLPNTETVKSIFYDIINDDDEVYIITARPNEFRYITEQWLEKYGIPYLDLILVGDNSKVGFVERYDIDVIIDDNPTLFLELEAVKDLFPKSKIGKKISEGKISRYIIDYPYNRDVESEFRVNRDTGEIEENE